MYKLLKQMLLVCVCLFALTGQAMADSLLDAQRAYGAGDYAKAEKLFKPLAKQGNALAQTSLGVMYNNGQGVPQDYVLAHMWLNIASATENDSARQKQAAENLDKTARLMTAQQIVEAQELARKCTANKFKGC
jgi:TPR repeat protein